jgi:hypothetical protein
MLRQILPVVMQEQIQVGAEVEDHTTISPMAEAMVEAVL